MAAKKTTESKKTVCPVSREEFKTGAKVIRIIVQQEDAPGQHTTLGIFDLPPKDMSTGSMGWHSAEKVSVKIGDKLCKTQGNLQLIMVGSKDLPK